MLYHSVKTVNSIRFQFIEATTSKLRMLAAAAAADLLIRCSCRSH